MLYGTALRCIFFSCELIARKCCKFGRIYFPRKWRPPKIGGPMRPHSSRVAKAGTGSTRVTDGRTDRQ